MKLEPPPSVVALVTNEYDPETKTITDKSQAGAIWKKWLSNIYSFLTIEDFRVVGDTDEPPFENGWVNFNANVNKASFYKDPFDRVHLSGLVKSGTIGAVPIFTLPEGYRPTDVARASTVSNDLFSYLRIDPDGSVEVRVGSNVWVDLSNISFRT